MLLNTNATGFAPCYSNRRRLLSIELPQQLGGSPRVCVCRPRAVQNHSEKELPRTGYLSSVLVQRRFARNERPFGGRIGGRTTTGFMPLPSLHLLLPFFLSFFFIADVEHVRGRSRSSALFHTPVQLGGMKGV